MQETTRCVNAEHGISLENHGAAKPCCMVNKNYNWLSDNTKHSITQSSLQDCYTNEVSTQLRENLKNGIRDPNCSRCWDEEDAGRRSKRIRDNERYEDVELTGLAILELNLGNTCNLACKTCGPSVSTGWIKEAFVHSKRTDQKEFNKQFKKFQRAYDDDADFWKQLEDNLPNVRELLFYGGEPFMIKRMWKVLQLCVDRGYAKDIEIHFNTNGTHWPKETSVFEHFKHVHLSFSIDGIGERFNSMRFNADWNLVCDNMRKASAIRDKVNINLSWCITVSSLNIYYIDEVIKEIEENWEDLGFHYYLNLVHQPAHWNVQNIPNNIKNKIKEHLSKFNKGMSTDSYQAIINFMMQGNSDPKQWELFKHNIDKQNKTRNEDWIAINKDYGKLILDG